MSVRQLPTKIGEVVGRPDAPFAPWPVWRITETAAQLLVRLGLAGYYSVFVKTPIEHPEWCVVHTQSAHYLAHADVLKVTDAGRLGNDALNCRAHLIDLNDQSPLYELIMRDKAEHALSLAESIEQRRQR